MDVGLVSLVTSGSTEEVVSVCARGGLDWISGRISPQKEWLGIGAGCLGSGGVAIPAGVWDVALRNVVWWWDSLGKVEDWT